MRAEIISDEKEIKHMSPGKTSDNPPREPCGVLDAAANNLNAAIQAVSQQYASAQTGPERSAAVAGLQALASALVSVHNAQVENKCVNGLYEVGPR